MSFNVEQIFQAVDVILTERLKDVQYDSTMICTVVDDSKKEQGYYTVSNGNVKFEAYTNDTSFKNDDQVRVSILNGDFSQKKFIDGEYIGDNNKEPVFYTSPLDTVLPTTDNLINTDVGTTINSEINEFYLLTNKTKNKVLWKAAIDENSKYKTLQQSGIYDTITLKASFLTDLGNLISGNYGLRLDLLIQSEAGSKERIDKIVTLDSNEMIGNPYSFEIYSPQEKTISISSAGIVTEIILSAYEGSYIDEQGSEIASEFINDNNEIIGNEKIWIKDITIGFGSNLIEIEDNSLKLYTNNSNTYVYNEGNGSEENDKQLGLIWYNKTENNEYVGFSDGVFDFNYDEIKYRKESYADARLMAQKGKAGVATDEESLTLAANIDEVSPMMIDTYTALTTDLAQVLLALKRQVTGTDFVDELNELISGDNAILVQAAGKAETATFNLVDEYNNILSYGYNKQNSIEPNEWDNNWATVDYYTTFKNEITSALNEVKTFMSSMQEKTVATEPLSGFRGIYDSYNIRVNREIEAIENLLSQINEIIKNDYNKLKAYKSKSNFTPYGEKDLDSYHNKYCIYWYRYKKGYSLTYNSEDNANNDEYLFGNFAGSNWERMAEYDNFGLPQDSKDGKYVSRSLTDLLLDIRMEPSRQEERFKVLLFYNHQMIESNILTFTNTEDVPNEYLVDAKDSLRIEHGQFSQDHFQSYSSAYDLVNISDGSKMRWLQCYYDGVLSGDETLAEATLYWYVPTNATMLTYDKTALIEQGFGTDAEEKTPYSRDGFIYFCKKVNSEVQNQPILDSNGNPMYDDTGKEMTEEVTVALEADRQFFYKIKSYYESNAQNNTIEVYAYIPNVTEPVKGAISFTFSTFGTNGTKYTLAVTPMESQIAVLPSGNDDYQLRLSLRDANNEELEITETRIIDPEDEAEGTTTGYNLSVQWYTRSKSNNHGLNIANIENSKNKLISIGSANNTDNNKYVGIVKSTVTINIGEEESRPANLTALTPIPYSTNKNYYISGPTTIVYNNQGTISRLSEEPFCLYQHNGAEGDIKVENQSWYLAYYDSNGNEVNNNETDILAYMPILNSDNTLRPAPMYYQYKDENNYDITYIPVAVCKISNSIVWSQPIVITQNQYASSTLNEWNGKFEINEANGTIMSTMIGAGIKTANNTFEGVLMGDIERGANFDTDNQSGIGLYGFNDGAQSFAFTVDGKAFLGKAGRGRIYFDGDSGTISSASYQQNRIPIEDDNGKIIGYEDRSTAGMMVDLDDGFIDIHGTVLEEEHYSPQASKLTQEEWDELPGDGNKHNSYSAYEKAYEADATTVDRKQSHIRIDVQSPYFTIHSANQINNKKHLMLISDDEYYLQTDNYAITDFPVADNTAASNGQGFKLDLMDGIIDAYNLKLTSKNLFINSIDENKPYFIIKNNEGRNLMFVEDGKYYLQSSDFVTKDEDDNGNGKGMKLTLDGGSSSDSSIEAYSFKLRSGDTGNGDHIIVIQDVDPYFLVNTNSGTSSNPETKTLASIGNNNFYFESADYFDEIDNQRGSGMRISISGHEIKAYEGFKLKAYQSNNSNNYILINSTDSDDKAYPLRVSDNFKVGWNGSINATGGTFTNITANGGTFNNISVSGTFTSGTITGATILGGTLDIGGDPTSAGVGSFSVASDGSVTINDKKIFHVTSSGQLTCTSANIGGWNVSGANSGLTYGKLSMTPLGGLNFNGVFTVDETGNTTIDNLIVAQSLTVKGTRTGSEVFKVNNTGDLAINGDLYAGSLTSSTKIYCGSTNVGDGFIVQGDAFAVYTSKIYLGKAGGGAGVGINTNPPAKGGLMINGTVWVYSPETFYLDNTGTTNLPTYIENHATAKYATALASKTSAIGGALTAYNVGKKTQPVYFDKGIPVKCDELGDLAFLDEVTVSVTNFSNTTVSLSNANSGVYKVGVDYEEDVTISYSGTTPAVWLGWDTDATGRIYSTEYTSESAASRRTYYTKATGQSYSGSKIGTASGTVYGYVKATVSTS